MVSPVCACELGLVHNDDQGDVTGLLVVYQVCRKRHRSVSGDIR